MKNVCLQILFEVERWIPIVREINTVGEGKLRKSLGDFYEILLGNPEKLVSLHWGIFGAVIGDFLMPGI